jgi:adenine-specific DNA methylase
VKPLLLESWLPIEAIGAESQRERGASSALPPLYFLHVWWARRPLTTSRAAILASVLPQWSVDFPSELRAKFPNEQTYFGWFTRLIGIFGDPVAARKLIEYEKRTGIATAKNKYGYRRAFTVTPSAEDLQTMSDLLEWTWGKRDLSVLDPFAGGGSIPFEALRYGFITYANELNPVASVILTGTLDYPFRYGVDLSEDILKWGKKWHEKAKIILELYFATPEKLPKRTIYMWARTVSCPVTGKIVPLSPNWWIKKEGEPVAARLICESTADEPRFEIYKGKKINFDPEEGTIIHGVGRSPWTGETISGDYIKAEAQAGRMGQFIYCVEVETEHGRDYVAPAPDDMRFANSAENALH